MLYRIVGAHAFLNAAAHHAEGARLPTFVEQEFRDFLTCDHSRGVFRELTGASTFHRLPYGRQGFLAAVSFLLPRIRRVVTSAGHPGHHNIEHGSRHVHTLFITYANVDRPALPPDAAAPRTRGGLEGWILARLQSTIREVRDALDAYQLPRAVRAVEDFVQDDLSNWYVRRRRRELWKGEMTEGKALAYRTLFHVLVRVCQLLAPVMPFVADHIYRELMAGRDAGTPRSVHLTPFPDPDAELVDSGLEEGVAFVRRVLRVGLGVRSAAALKVRQPLAQMLVLAPPAMLLWLREFEANVLEELNIEAMDAAPTDAAVADTLRAHGRATWAPTGHAPVVLTSGDGPLRAATDGDVVVALDTRLTDALERKGFARQLVHQIQLLRKTAGLAVDDRIHLAIATDAHRLAASMSTAPTSVRRRWRSTSWSGSPRPAASSSMCAWTRGRQSSVSAGSIGRWRPCAEMETPAERWKATVSTSSRMWTRRPP